MEYSVYKIIEPTSREVAYVGQTKRLKLRIAEHTKYDYPTRPAKFMGHDHEVIESGLTKIESLEREAHWKDFYGLEKTETANRTWKRKITFEQAEEMRALYATGDYTFIMLKELYPLSNNAISRILSRGSYKS